MRRKTAIGLFVGVILVLVLLYTVNPAKPAPSPVLNISASQEASPTDIPESAPASVTAKPSSGYASSAAAPSGSSYSPSNYSSTKTKKCLECGDPIYADETWCDDCLFGSFEADTDSYDNSKTNNYSNYGSYRNDDSYGSSYDPADYDKYGNYKPVESMTSEEILEELKSFFDD